MKKSKVISIIVCLIVTVSSFAMISKMANEDLTDDSSVITSDITVESDGVQNVNTETTVINEETSSIKTADTEKTKLIRNSQRLAREISGCDTSLVDGETIVLEYNIPTAAAEATTLSAEETTFVPNVIDNSTIAPVYCLFKATTVEGSKKLPLALTNKTIKLTDSAEFTVLTKEQQSLVIGILAVGYPNNNFNCGNQNAYAATFAAVQSVVTGGDCLSTNQYIQYAYNEILKEAKEEHTTNEIDSEVYLICNNAGVYTLTTF